MLRLPGRRGLSEQGAGGSLSEGDRRFGQHRMEESFTVHLGTQRKTMHNLRLMTGVCVCVCVHMCVCMRGRG